jgi:hypothetical protein
VRGEAEANFPSLAGFLEPLKSTKRTSKATGIHHEPFERAVVEIIHCDSTICRVMPLAVSGFGISAVCGLAPAFP